MVFNRFLPHEIIYKMNYKKIITELRNLGKEQIEKRLKLIQEGLSAPSDLLSIVLKSWENEEFDLEDMIDDFITFFIAGQETTANTLAFCIIELSKNPNIVTKYLTYFKIFRQIIIIILIKIKRRN